MDKNYLRRLRRRARNHSMVIRKNWSGEGGYRLLDVEDIEERPDWLEEDQ